MKTLVWVLLGMAVVSMLPCFTVSEETCATPCGTNRICNNGTCICQENWFGDDCMEFICDAHQSVCFAGGVCYRAEGNDFRCACPEGYGGTLCECNEGVQPIKLCPIDSSKECGDYGTCIIDPVQKIETCKCAAGWGGDMCDEEIDHCLTRGCGVGTCKNFYDTDNTRYWYMCTCPDGYNPESQCGPVYDSCFDEPCGDHGNCSLPVPHVDKSYICTCEPGYTGHNCSTPISHCEDSPCQNGATCDELTDFSGYSCTCPPYFTGDDCQIPYDPCECESCSNNGLCLPTYTSIEAGMYNYSTSCNCTSSFSGTYCDIDVDECTLLSPCLNEGMCVNTNGGYLCVCEAGYTGDVCDIDIDDCISDPCMNGGTCQDGPNRFTCDCNSTKYTGPTCSIPLNQTCEAKGCHFGGLCEFDDLLRKPVCTCNKGFTGELCLYVYQPCSNGSCDPEGTLECLQDSVCRCRDGYSGPTCSINVFDTCQHNECINNGTCNDINGTFHCYCPPGFSGRNCEISIDDKCQGELQCLNEGDCYRIVDEEFCRCKEGWGGHDCSIDIDECLKIPCENGGSCINLPGTYQCSCPVEFDGLNCESLKPFCQDNLCENGATCILSNSTQTSCMCTVGFEGKRCEKQICPYNECSALANNGICDLHCFTHACDYDGGRDPCFTRSGSNPWANCTVANCSQKYSDGYCDQQCNNAKCLYDGSDCDANPASQCPKELADRCAHDANDGVCDPSCNTDECPIDTVDCGGQLYLPNYLILIIKSEHSVVFEGEERDEVLLKIGRLIHAMLELVEQKEISEDELESEGYAIDLIPSSSDDSSYRYWRLVLKVNIQFCLSSCPTTIDQVLKQIQAAYSNGQTDFDGFTIVDSISGDIPSDDSSSGGISTGQIIGGIVGVLGSIVLVGVLAFVLGKRVRSDGGVKESLKRVVRVRGTFRIPGGSTPEPSEANLMTRGQSCSSDRNSGSIDTFDDPSPSSVRKSGTSLPHFTWTQMEVPVKNGTKEGATCILGQKGKDGRKWTYLHCEAARMSGDGRDFVNMNNSLADINTQGPGGLTPLMVAILTEDKLRRTRALQGGSVRSDSSSGSEYSEYDQMLLTQSPKFPRMFSTLVHSKQYESKIPSLIHAPQSNINLVNDQGETALHLAVKHNRDEYIHYLLLAKASPNVQDKWGKTPLHMAIGAVNDRAFHILMESPIINLELKSHGGITPLMLAVKMGNTRALQMLLAKNAEITSTDIEGRTAVHWAAMINNVEALRLLIKQGPDNVKDAPNLKGETALFLACREGCIGAVRHLLDCYANATLVDSLERSPYQIAMEKQNIDVIQMLQQSNQGPLGGGPSPPMYPVKPPHSVTNQMFGGIKMEPSQMASIMHSQASAMGLMDRYPLSTMPSSDGMTRCSSIEAELERLVASTQYPDMMGYPHNPAMNTYVPHPVVSQTHMPSTADGGHSPGHSIISPQSGGLSPGDSSTDHNFSPMSSDIYPTTNHASPPAGLTPYSCANGSALPSSSSAQQQLAGSTPLQHLPTPYVEGGVVSVNPTTSELQSTSMEPTVYTSTMQSVSNNSPMMGQTVSPNPTPLTMAQAITVNGYTTLQATAMTGNNSPSSHYGFPSPPKEAGEYPYGTPYNGDNVNSVSSMTPSPEDGSLQQLDGSPHNQQYTTIRGQYSYSSDPYQISLQPCASTARSHFPGMSGFNPKESTV